MKVVSHFPAIGVSNTYVIGPESGGRAILVDPGCFDVALLELIEANDFYISAVLITHNHKKHAQGLGTLLRIYRAEVVAGSDTVFGHPAMRVDQGWRGKVGEIEYAVRSIEGHYPDSRIFEIGPYLFTGDSISSGHVGSTPTPHSREILIKSLWENLLSLPSETIILPGHGPPTTVGVERKWNLELQAGLRPSR